MVLRDIMECEKRSFRKQMKELKLLPHKYFKIGIFFTIASFVGIISLNIMGDYLMAKQVIKNVITTIRKFNKLKNPISLV